MSVVPGKRFRTNWINTFLEEIGKRRGGGGDCGQWRKNSYPIKVPSIPKLQFPW